ncbi:MAG: RtcB family protein [Microscillaceae bacterium]
MKKNEKIMPRELKQLGFYDLELCKAAGKTAKRQLQKKLFAKEIVLAQLKAVLDQPETFLNDDDFKHLAGAVVARQAFNEALRAQDSLPELRKTALPYTIYGAEGIEAGAKKQMEVAMQLPIALAGALMPDAHQGYGLPIGGVLATEPYAVIPYAVGVDIACRMCLSIFETEASYLDKHAQQLKNLLLKNTCFGAGKGFEKPMADDLFDRPEWQATKVIRDLKKKALAQVGTSGTGNHFVEWGWLEINTPSEALGLPSGQYLALLSHSGSRGFGAGIAAHYTQIALQTTPLPAEAKHLAWLDLRTEAGQEYWIGMQLAGDYAAANHHHIHKKMARDLGLAPLKMIENHHNFAWKELLSNGQEVIVHRKGATPAQAGVLGIIPGSMSQPGFVVEGLGQAEALLSASHGAGRLMSRGKAKKDLRPEDWEAELRRNKVSLMGGDLDEAPMAYKDLHQVMLHQAELVKALARFVPRIVRMADAEKSRPHRKKSPRISFEES